MHRFPLHFLIILFFIIGCGGVSKHEPREIKTLYFKGPAVNGIEYHCGERQGITKTIKKANITYHGAITCTYPPIKFYLNSLYLGKVNSIRDKQSIYPQDLVPSFDGSFKNKALLKIAILLQSINEEKGNKPIIISQKTKAKITLKTLEKLTIEQLNQEIQRIGFTPISAQEAKINLILNSENTNIGKPTIQHFEEDISTNLRVGSIIGKILIDAGDGTLHYPFTLKGKGSKYFFLNDNGNLILTQSIEEENDYNLTITTSNEYGFTKKSLNIHVINESKIGKAQMGRLKGATVELFKLNPDGSKTLIDSTSTKTTGVLNQIGNFNLMTDSLDDHEFYIYELSGGVDIDVNNDNIIDNKSTPNQGKLHLLTKGIWIKNSMHKIRITPLSEILYTYVKKFNYNQLEEQLNILSTLLLKDSINSSQQINVKDIMIFDPINNKNALSPTLIYNKTYQTITNKIRLGDSSYKSDIFSAYVVDSFQSNAIEIIESTVYTIDMMDSGEFRIYDLETKKLIGKLKLPYTPVTQDTHVIYINLLGKDVRVSSLEDWSYNIKIKNQNKPVLIKTPFIEYIILSGRFNGTAIGKSYEKNTLSNERRVYFYEQNTTQNSTKIIKFFSMTEENKVYQYEFDSKLENIISLWEYKSYLYAIGDNKIHIFQEKNKKMNLASKYTTINIKGNILGVEEDILYILDHKTLILFEITNPLNPKFIEKFSVPFKYKLGIKTNGAYLTTGSKIISIKALRASKNAN